jgi:ABC-2 type transport system ATP-binding protein
VTVADAARVAEVSRLVGALPGAEPPTVVDDRVVGRVPHGGAALVELVRGLDRENIAIRGIESRRPSLDDVFLGLTGRSLRDAEAPAASPAQEVTRLMRTLMRDTGTVFRRAMRMSLRNPPGWSSA